MNKEMRICTFGGGTGMPVINQALIKAGFKNIKSIVTTFDNGGDTGRMRTDENGQILAFSDYWRALISLWSDGEQKKIWEDMLRYRDSKDRNFGNMFFKFMAERTGDLGKVDNLFKKLTMANLIGQVIPVSLEPANLCFETISGKNYCGEQYLDDLRMSSDYVVKIWMKPEINANVEAIKAVKEADLIIVCPGSVYGSLLINFLPKGIKEAFAKSGAEKMLMTNIMSVANENCIKDQIEYLKLFEKYIGSSFDEVLVANLEKLDKKKLKKIYTLYALEGSSPIKYVPNDQRKSILADVVTIDKVNWRLRHSKSKLANFFSKMEICPKRN